MVSLTKALMPIANSKKRSGTVLLEAVIAIGVILVGVVGSLVLLNTSISLGRANQDKIVAQNLAREGMELAYGLRNSGSLRHVDDPKTTWSSYILNAVLKSADPTFCVKYDLGDMVGTAGSQTCKQYSATQNTGNFTQEHNDQCGGGTLDAGSTAQQQIQCDVDALSNYMYERWAMPPGCAGSYDPSGNPSHLGNGIINAPVDCNYDGQGSVDISDLTYLIDALFLQSYQFDYGYPTIAATGSNVDGHFSFNNPFADPSNFEPATGKYLNLQKIWDDPKARVQSANGTFVQNVTVTGATNTKFYRVVNLQPVCRGTKGGATVEVVTDPNSGLNCADFVASQSLGWDAGVSMVGALVTSEVRWPTPSSQTKVKYQEFLYDWITL